MRPPKDKILWATYSNGKSKVIWQIYSDKNREHYYLYRIEGEKLVKVKISDSPAEFEDIVGMSI